MPGVACNTRVVYARHQCFALTCLPLTCLHAYILICANSRFQLTTNKHSSDPRTQ